MCEDPAFQTTDCTDPRLCHLRESRKEDLKVEHLEEVCDLFHVHLEDAEG